jgi:hypothetical protein
MKEVWAITEKIQEGRTRPNHVLFGIDKDSLRSATRQTDARLKINWNRDFEWGLMCTDKTYKWLVEHLMFDGFDPYEIENASGIYLKEMERKNIKFYKEVQMI